MVAAMYALASCGGQSSAATPTIEYRTPVGVAHGSETTVARGVVGMAHTIPAPPSCAVGCEPPTQTPTTTPTPIPIATPAPTEVESQDVATIVPTSETWSDAAYAGQCGAYPATVTQWWPVITQYPWDACTVLAIIQRESRGLNVYNYQGSGACGVMQLLPCEYPNDGAANIAAGFAKYEAALAAWGDGWHPWAVD